MLRPVRNAGIRVLLAPGNHDISTAYDPVMSRTFLRKSGRGLTDARKLISYLEMAVVLDEHIASHDGRKLKDILDQEVQPVVNLTAKWQRAADAALNELKIIPGLDEMIIRSCQRKPPYALRYLSRFDRRKADLLLKPLVEEAIANFKDFERAFLYAATKETIWKKMFTASLSCELNPLYLALRWQRLWFDVFPLKLVDHDNKLEFVIANSNVSEVGLFGSAFGTLTKDQEARVQRCIAASSQPIVVVLMHHPICRWSDDQYKGRWPNINVNRWGLLAHDTEEARRLPTIICSAAPSSCRQILLCGGHVHSTGRAGRLIAENGKGRLKGLERLLILENPALPDVTWKVAKMGPRAGDLLLCERTASGRLRAGRIAWRQLLNSRSS
jgi:hypothetical protein